MQANAIEETQEETARLERATEAAYAACVEQAPQWNSPEDMGRFVPWVELAEAWKARWRVYIRAALEAADND